MRAGGGVAQDAMRGGVEAVGLAADGAAWNAGGKVIGIGGDVGQIVVWPGAGVNIEPFDRGIDFTARVEARCFLRFVTASHDARKEQGGHDPQDRDDRQQFQQGECGLAGLVALHDASRRVRQFRSLAVTRQRAFKDTLQNADFRMRVELNRL